MKLFIWENVLQDYTSGVAFAFAENALEARSLIVEKMRADKSFVPKEFLIELRAEPLVIEQKEVFYLYGGA